MDFVRAMWLMLQQDKPDDYIVATGVSHSVREFVELAFQEIGVEIEWRGEGVDEVGVVVGGERLDANAADFRERSLRAGDVVVEVDPRYFRPTEVEYLLGDASKAREVLGWEPKISFNEMVAQMVKEDLEEAARDQLCRESGFKVHNYSDE